MLQKNEKKAGTLRIMLAIMVLLLLIILLENKILVIMFY